MPRVAAPVPSPDGRWVVFSVTEPAYEASEQVADLWIKSLADDSAPRRLTGQKSGEGGPEWSPDSTRIAFTAKREGDEAAQVYVLNLAGGEAERITSLSTGAGAPKWSPDGKRFLFVSTVYPAAADDAANRKIAKERKERKTSARVYDGFPVRHWDHWLDDRRPHVFVQDAVPGAVARDLLAGTALVGRPGFGGVLGSSSEGMPAVWSPDGASVVFAATVERDQAARAEPVVQLFRVPAAGGEPQVLTGRDFSHGGLEFSRDGRWLLATGTAVTGKVYNLPRLLAYPWPFAEAGRRVLTAGFDRSVLRFAQPGRGERIYFTHEDAGLIRLASVPLAGGPVRAENSPATGAVGGLAAGGDALVATWESTVSPAEIWSFGGVEPRRLTRLTAARLEGLDLQPAEHVWFTARSGRRIHSLLVRPPGFDPARRYPLVVLLHGGPHSQWSDDWHLRWNAQLLAAPGYVLLMPNFTGSTGFGEEFARAVEGDPFASAGDEINQAVDDAVARFPFIDGRRVAAGGASWGGHLANWLQATTTRYQCLFSHAGLVRLESQWGTSDENFHRERTNGGPIWEQNPIWSRQDPADLAGNRDRGTGWRTPMLITQGELDFRVPLNNALENWALHQRLAIPSRLIVFPDENHWIQKGENSRFFYAELHRWLAQWL